MSQADLETVRAGYEAMNRGDWNAVLALMHPDIELKTTLFGTHVGHGEIRRVVEDQLSPFEEVIFEPFDFFERGDQVVVFVLIRYRLRRSSVAPPAVRVGTVWTMRDGKAIRCETFPRREQALEAAGLSE
jgi:ketosteroid isomerase-like protein